jgi:hypothetical protein
MGLGACGRFRPSRASAPVGLSSAQASLGQDVTDGTLLRRLVGRIAQTSHALAAAEAPRAFRGRSPADSPGEGNPSRGSVALLSVRTLPGP